ncbi:MAG: hypothetical protein ACYSU7_17470, partial [Planctomycetota bacterium]
TRRRKSSTNFGRQTSRSPVAHRQFAFTIPKRLRIFFRFDRPLLRALPRLAWQTVLEVYRTVLDRPDAVPGLVG